MNSLRQREVALIAAESVSPPAIEHGALAEMSSMAAVAASCLQTGRTPTAEDGTEEDYGAIAAGVARRYAPPSRR
jgi:hypothetical protein